MDNLASLSTETFLSNSDKLVTVGRKPPHNRSRYRTTVDVPKWDMTTIHLTNQATSKTSYGPVLGGDAMIDVVTPGYQSMSQRGVVITSPMSHTSNHTAVEPAAYTYSVTKNGVMTDGWTVVGACYPYTDRSALNIVVPVVTPPSVGSVPDQVINRAFAEAKASAAMIMVDFAERAKTIEMLRAPMAKAQKDLRSGFGKRRAPRRGERVFLGRLGSVASGAANGWLEWRYGWGPLAYSIQDILKAWDRTVGHLEVIRRVGRSKDFVEAAGELSATASYPWNNLPNRWDSKTTVSERHFFRAGCIVQVRTSLVREMGLSLSALPATKWDLVPYSWMIDWFVDVGTWLKAVTPVAGVTVEGSWLSSKVDREMRIVTSHPAESADWQVGADSYSARHSACTMSYSTTATQKARIVGVSPSTLPTVDTRLRNLKHVIDTLAVGFQQFRPKGRK